MALSCSGSIGAVLHYQGAQAQVIRVLNPQGIVWSSEVNALISIAKPNNPSNYLTWEWVEDLWSRRWAIKCSYTSGYSHMCGESKTWETSIRQPTDDVELVLRDNLYYGFYISNDAPYVYSNDPNGYWVSINRLMKVNQCGTSTNNPLALNASIDSVEPFEGNNTVWKLNFYENGERVKTVSLSGVMDNPPVDAILSTTDKTYMPVTKNFEKQPDTEALELLPLPNAEEAWQLWRVQIDENQNPISKEIIYQFQGKEPELYCIDGEECPPNTCKVECPEHFCCYNSEGISVYSFPKT